jgi:hypothetical protein
MGKMFRRLIINLAYKILDKNGGCMRLDNIYIVRMSSDFKEWVYSEGYELYKNKKE